MEQNKMLEMEQFLAYQFMDQDDQRKRAYICSPLSAKTDEEFVENMHRARRYMHYAAKDMGLAARAPHAYLPMLLCDRVPNERALALQFGLRLLEESDILMVCGDRISLGMQGEILHAISIKTKILTFSHQMYLKVCEYVRKENGDTVLDGELRETQTADCFSGVYLIDNTVLPTNACLRQIHGTLLSIGKRV